MRRVVVVGANGFFGRQALRALATLGIRAVPATRREGLNAEDPAAIRAFVRADDVVLDTAGPFHRRTTALLDACLERRADLVDLSDSAAYAAAIAAERDRIEASGRAVLTGCSAISAVVATLVRASGVPAPARVDAWLAPASHDTAHVATARAFIASIRGGARRRCAFADVTGFPVDSALRIQLPAIWPSLESAAFWVDAHTHGFGPVLALAARARPLRAALWLAAPVGVRLTRLLGACDGIVAVRVADDARETRWVLTAPRGSYRIAIAPAALAVRDLAAGTFAPRGLVPADRMVGSDALIEFVERLGIRVTRS